MELKNFHGRNRCGVSFFLRRTKTNLCVNMGMNSRNKYIFFLCNQKLKLHESTFNTI